MTVPSWMPSGVPAPALLYQAYGAADFDSSLVNLARENNLYNLIPTSFTAANWSAEGGWEGDGSTNRYFDTGYVAPHLNITMMVWFTDAATDNDCAVGTSDGSSANLYLFPRYDTPSSGVLYGNGKTIVKGPWLNSGTLWVAGLNGYRDGVLDVAIASGGTAPTGSLKIMAMASNQYLFNGKVRAVILWESVLTATQIAAVDAAIKAWSGTLPAHTPLSWYASPTATDGTGTLADPFTLTQALASTQVWRGDTLYLRGGTYSGDFTCSLNGTADNQITIKPYLGESPVIDGSFILGGSNTKITNNGNSRIRFTYSGWTTRETAIAGSTPEDLPWQKTLSVPGVGCAVINCLIDNLAGFGLTNAAIGSLSYGNIIRHVGWLGPERGHGHSDYSQNVSTTRQVHKRNVWYAPFGYGGHFYTEGGNIDYLDVIENIAFRTGFATVGGLTGILLGGYVDANYPRVIGNLLYDTDMALGYDHPVKNAIYKDNYSPSGVNITAGATYAEEPSGNTVGTIGNRVVVMDNEYMTGGGFVVVYNEDEADSITVDLSSITGIFPGDAVCLWNVQAGVDDMRYLIAGIDKTISVDMRAASYTVAAPYEWATAPTTTFPTFGCFVVDLDNESSVHSMTFTPSSRSMIFS